MAVQKNSYKKIIKKRKATRMFSHIFKVEGSGCEFTVLPGPISMIGENPVLLNEKHFIGCASRDYLPLKGRPLSIFGVELEKKTVSENSILALGLKGGEPTKSLMLKCLKNYEGILKSIRQEMKAVIDFHGKKFVSIQNHIECRFHPDRCAAEEGGSPLFITGRELSLKSVDIESSVYAIYNSKPSVVNIAHLNDPKAIITALNCV